MIFWCFVFASKIFHLTKPDPQELLHTNTMFKLTHTDKDRLLRWLWFGILSPLNWTAWSNIDSWVTHMFHSCVRTSIDKNKTEVHTLIMWFSLELKLSLDLWFCSRQPCSYPNDLIKGKEHVTVSEPTFISCLLSMFVSVTRLLDLLNVTTMTWTINDYWPSDCCVTGRQMLKLHIWDL